MWCAGSFGVKIFLYGSLKDCNFFIQLFAVVPSAIFFPELIAVHALRLGTVDSFQGQERDIIAITLTHSNPQGAIGILSDIRRWNVGMTRAWRKLLLMGDSATLRS